MKIQNLLTLILGVLGFGITGISQNFQSTIFRSGLDYNHYSIETTPGGDYVCAGTLFDAAGRTDIHVIRLDVNGNIIWERTINQSDDDRALDVLVDPAGDIVVTGYISPTAVNYPELYVVKLDGGGNYIADRTIQQFHASAGTNVIYSNSQNTYIVGGFYSEPLSVPLIGNEAMIVEFDMGLNYLNHMQYSSADQEHSAINDIVEIPGGYFITGSVGNASGYPIGEQGVLAMRLDFSFGITANLTFEATNLDHNGVSLWYDSSLDEILLMSNNSVIHNPQITYIRDVSGAPFIATEYYLELDPTYGMHNAAGFELQQCDWDPSTYVACGYFRTQDDGSGSNVHAIPWIVQFDKNTGAQVAGLIWPAPSPNFHAHGGGIFSTFSGEHPYIFNQEIMTLRADRRGYVFIGPRDVGGNFGIDVVTTLQMEPLPCYERIGYDNISISSVLIPAGDNFTAVTDPTPGAPVDPFNSDFRVFCEELYAACAPPVEQGGVIIMDSEIEEHGTASTGGLSVNPEDFKVSPNPFTTEFNIELTGENLSGQLVLLNAVGQVVYKSDQLGGNYFRTTVNMEPFEQGIYILKLSNGNKELTKRVVKL